MTDDLYNSLKVGRSLIVAKLLYAACHGTVSALLMIWALGSDWKQ